MYTTLHALSSRCYLMYEMIFCRVGYDCLVYTRRRISAQHILLISYTYIPFSEFSNIFCDIYLLKWCTRRINQPPTVTITVV